MAKIPKIQFVRYRFCCLVGGNYPEGFLSKLRSQKGIPSICATKIFSKHLFYVISKLKRYLHAFSNPEILHSMSYITGWNPEKKTSSRSFSRLAQELREKLDGRRGFGIRPWKLWSSLASACCEWAPRSQGKTREGRGGPKLASITSWKMPMNEP